MLKRTTLFHFIAVAVMTVSAAPTASLRGRNRLLLADDRNALQGEGVVSDPMRASNANQTPVEEGNSTKQTQPNRGNRRTSVGANNRPIQGGNRPIQGGGNRPIGVNGGCNRKMDPVYCGLNNQFFSNMCFAMKSGFTVSQCRKTPIEGEDSANETPISGNQYPVNEPLQENNEVDSDAIQANDTNGTQIEEDGNVSETPIGQFVPNNRPKPNPNPPSSLVSSNLNCRRFQINPVRCGPNNQTFKNPCYARKNGFYRHECRSTHSSNGRGQASGSVQQVTNSDSTVP